MKKTLILYLIMMMIFTSAVVTVPIFADSPEILLNPGFEDDIDYWQPQVVSTMLAVDYWEGTTPQNGNVFVLVSDRYSYSDTPLQIIREPLNFYGQGNYKVRGYIRLAPASSLSTTKAQIVIRLVSSGVTWVTSGFVEINKTSWTLMEATINLTWSEDLETAEFYFMTDSDAVATDLCFDNTSMIKVGYEGPAYVPPTPTPSPTPKPATPTTPPTPTLTPSPTSPPTPTVPATPTPPVSASSTSVSSFSIASSLPASSQISSVEASSSDVSSIDPESSEDLSEGSAIVSEDLSENDSQASSISTVDASSEAVSDATSDPEKSGLSTQSILGIVILVILIAGGVLIGLNRKNRKISS